MKEGKIIFNKVFENCGVKIQKLVVLDFAISAIIISIFGIVGFVFVSKLSDFISDGIKLLLVLAILLVAGLLILFSAIIHIFFYITGRNAENLEIQTNLLYAMMNNPYDNIDHDYQQDNPNDTKDIKCNNCGATVQMNDKFCEHCGAPLT